jgi:RNA polymerase sigma-70 factor, ECF subfamily
MRRETHRASTLVRMDAGPATGDAAERRVLDAARSGDQDAFRRLVEPHRTELHAHCYRMLGSLHDAEDALQETMLRAWRGLPRFQEDRALRPWLYKIATNACLDAIARRPKRVLPLDYGAPASAEAGPGKPLAETIWLEPYPDDVLDLPDGYAGPEARYEQRESVELAFVAALQHLTARQRAVLVLREVLGFSAREVAESLETTAASVNSALQRARRTVDERLPARSQQATLRSLGDERLRDVVQRYVEAWESRNVEALRALLVEDASFEMPPHPNWFHGRDTVIAFIVSTGTPRLRHVQTRANGQPAIGWYLWSPSRDRYVATALEVLTLEGDRVKDIIAFVLPEAFPRFELPPELPAQLTD